MQDLTISLIQSDLYWHDRSANLAQFEEKIWQIEESTDIIILPEMFTTGFTMDVGNYSEPMRTHTFNWMEQMAAQKNAVITGSYIVNEGGHYYNRMVWMQPDGTYVSYDKRHLFRMSQEHRYFSSGRDFVIAQWKDWRICPLICYDLRFPSWSRNSYLIDKEIMDYDLLIYVANWPIPRIGAWDILLQARAIENLSYVAGVNRIGIDGNSILYNGHSRVINFKGEIEHNMNSNEGIYTHTLKADELIRYRKKFPTYLDADNVEVK
ncbi:MAG: amidohydrolase [Cyclobacteriaceae bacterium]|nr:amidohydrolase [Cyclobacteriaceae bacterium]